jgi:hypothetical protein
MFGSVVERQTEQDRRGNDHRLVASREAHRRITLNARSDGDQLFTGSQEAVPHFGQ